MKNQNSEFQLDATITSDELDSNSFAEEELDCGPDDEGRIVPMEYIPPKLPAAQIEKIKQQYDCVVVQDFSDDYHMTEEEKSSLYEFYNLFKRMNSMKMKYRKLPDFIRGYREGMKCLKAVAEVNGAYRPEKFISLVLKGKIKVSGLKLPVYLGSKKRVNWDRVIEYVMDTSLDPDDFLAKENEARFEITTEDIVQEYSELYYDGNIDSALSKADEDTVPTDRIFDADEESTDGKNVVTPMPKKLSKKMTKKNQSIIWGIEKYKKESRTANQLKDYAFQMTEEDFATIERMDSDRKESDIYVPEFIGEIFNDDDYNLYMYKLDQYERKHTYVDYNDKLISYEDAELLQLKEALDESGWNLREFYNAKEEEKKERRKNKKLEKRKEELKRRLAKIDARSSKVNSKKKKRKKRSNVQKKVNEAVSNILSDDYDNFEVYTSSMETWGD